MMDNSDEELFSKKELRKKKDKKRARQSKEMEDCTKESFKRMKDEIDELRKRELDRAKEFDELKRKIEEQTCNGQIPRDDDYALKFSKDIYLSKGFIESAKWIKEFVAKNMIDAMNEEKNREKFEVLLRSKKASTYLGIRTCARYNRGEMCNYGKWHSTHKPEVHGGSSQNQLDQNSYLAHRLRKANLTEDQIREQQGPSIQDRLGRKNEIRLHACTLCMEALGSANGHSVLNCPWILLKNWT